MARLRSRYSGKMTSWAQRSATSRRPSLGDVLELVHRSAGITRADLTAQTGLNRSTIAAVVAELTELGFVSETEAPGERRVGRPSPLVVPALEPVVLAVNPEIDAIELAIVGSSARLHHRERIPTDTSPTPDDLTAVIVSALGRMQRRQLRGRRILGIGLAIPGMVRGDDGLVRWAPHLHWREAPIARMVADATGLTTTAANDASVGAIAEHRFGAGRGVDDLVYLNGSASGIGGGVILAGSPLHGTSGYAGEFGQNRPGLAEIDDRVTEHGTVEDEVSRARVLDLLGLPAADETTLDAALAVTKDRAVLAELARQRRVLAIALANAVNVLNPRMLVLGGYLASLRDGDPEALDAAVAAAAIPAAIEDVSIVTAALGPDRLLIGAAEVALAAVLTDPAAASALA